MLTELYLLSKKVIPCKPIKKIVDDNMVVGLITITNQFIPVIPEPHDKSHIDDTGRDENGLIVIENNNGVENYLTQPSLNDNTVDVVFTEHVIEHVSFTDGIYFFNESKRILKNGGVLRIVCPMIEKIIENQNSETYFQNFRSGICRRLSCPDCVSGLHPCRF